MHVTWQKEGREVDYIVRSAMAIYCAELALNHQGCWELYGARDAECAPS
jgi:hypothetical protein